MHNEDRLHKETEAQIGKVAQLEVGRCSNFDGYGPKPRHLTLAVMHSFIQSII